MLLSDFLQGQVWPGLPEREALSLPSDWRLPRIEAVAPHSAWELAGGGGRVSPV